MADSILTNLAGTQIMFASLCSLVNSAISGNQHNPALIAACLLAVMATPLAEPQNKIPNAASPEATLDSVGCA